MTVAIPAGYISEAEPYFIDTGGVQTGSLGGGDKRINRRGSRWGCEFTTKTMQPDEARIIIRRLITGRKEKASIKFPQPGVSFPTIQAAVTAGAASNAEFLQLANGQYLEGQFFSVVTAGQGFVYQVKTNSNGLVEVQPAIRRPIPPGDIAMFQQARIEGYIKGDQTRWTVDVAKKYGLSFRLEEAG